MDYILDARKEKILELLSHTDRITVKELSKKLEVTEVTIRTDLDALAENGKVQRIHGGARLIEERVKQEINFQTRKSLNQFKKIAIGKLAAKLVDPLDSLLLDASSTVLAFAREMKKREDLKDVTVIPTGIWTAIELMGSACISVLLPGGYLRHTTGSITGLPSHDFIGELIIQKAFLGAWGVSAVNGLTDNHLFEIDMKKNVISRVKEVIVLVDGSKFNQSGLASYSSIDNVSKIITDNSAPPEEVDKIRKRGIEVLIA